MRKRFIWDKDSVSFLIQINGAEQKDFIAQPPVPLVQMKAVHEQDEEGGADVGVIEEAEEVEQGKDGQVECGQKSLVVVVKLKRHKKVIQNRTFTLKFQMLHQLIF